jgi:hypothetical protein
MGCVLARYRIGAMIATARLSLVAFLILVCLACAGSPRGAGNRAGKEGPAMDSAKPGDLSRVDHVILGINDLQQGIDDLERLTGVRAAFGGVHPGRGTQNALISLGDGHYLEILAPNLGERSGIETDYLRALTSLRPVGWAVHTDDLTALQKRLRDRGVETEEIRPGARDRPDGTHLAWKTLDYAASTRLLPFFIEWDRAGAHPSTTSPQGCRLRGLYLEDPSPDALREALDAAGLKLGVRAAQEPGLRLSLVCPKGNVDF